MEFNRSVLVRQHTSIVLIDILKTIMSFCTRVNEFCFICGQFLQSGVRKYPMESAGNRLSVLYKEYFNRNYPGDVWYAPSLCCESCHRTLYGWSMHEAYKSFEFSRPMIWRERFEGHDKSHCYFCKTNTHGFNHHTRHHIQYAYSELAIQPFKRFPTEPPPPPPLPSEPVMDNEAPTVSGLFSEHSDYLEPGYDMFAEMRQISQSSFNDICRNIK